MSRSRAIIALLALALALPSAAFAQGAGDEQYQDPFGDEQAQSGGGQSTASQDDGLSQEPPVGNGGGDAGAGGGAAGETPEAAPEAPAQAEPALPNTGSDPRILAFLGALFVLTGVGLRLRTVDPDDF